MDAEKRKALEAIGWRFYEHAGDAVGMTEEEKQEMDLRIDLSRMIRKRRELLGITQKELAARLKTSQPRVAKIEQGDWGVSLDQIFRAYAVMGGRLAIKELSNNGTNDTGKHKRKVKRKAKAKAVNP